MTRAERQKIWDELLLEGWHRFLPMSKVYGVYSSMVPGPFTETLNDLKRVPRVRKAGVRVAVHGSMGWLSRQLWAGKRSDAELIKIMTEHGYDLEKEVPNNVCNDTREHRAAKLQAQRVSDKLSRNPSRDWGVTKPVRAKCAK